MRQRATVPGSFVVAAVAGVAALVVLITSAVGGTDEQSGSSPRRGRSPAAAEGSRGWVSPLPTAPPARTGRPGRATALAPAAVTPPSPTPPSATPPVVASTTVAPTAGGELTAPPAPPGAPSATSPTTTPLAGPKESPPPPEGTISAWLDAPDAIVSGSTTTASVIVHNGAGRPLTFSACGTPYAAALGDPVEVLHRSRPSCRDLLRLPMGTSRWPVWFAAVRDPCLPAGAAPPPGGGGCTPGEAGGSAAPGLPPGDYTLSAAGIGWFPPPPPVPVEVLPAG